MNQTPKTLLELKNVSFGYRTGDQSFSVLRQLNLSVHQGEFVAIQGPSGSGKSTLFYVIGCLLRPSCGQVLFDGHDVTKLGESALAFFRNRNIGFVFQQFHLLPRATVLDNILLPARYPAETAVVTPEIRARATELAIKLGLGDFLDRAPNQLSGGQQQRVAIARALLQDVDIILADEPTGNLDSKNAAQVMDLFGELHRQGKTIIIITHDSEIAARCQRVFHFKDGVIERTEVRNTIEITRTQSSAIKTQYQEPDSLLAQLRLARSSLPLVIQNILRNRTKSLLTMVGVIIGVAAVLSMISLGQFTKRRVLEGYESMGVNKLSISGYPSWDRKATDTITGTAFQGFQWERDLKTLPEVIPEVTYVSPQVNLYATQFSYRGRVVQANSGDALSLLGVSHQFAQISNSNVALGNFISPFHVGNFSRVCVVGADVAKELGTNSADILNEIISASIENRINFPCKVIGVLESRKGEHSTNKMVLVPFTTLTSIGNDWSSKIHRFYVKVPSANDVEDTGIRIRHLFESRYGKSGRFNVDNEAVMLAQMKRFLNIFNILLGAIAFVSLMVGGIGIHNMMLVSVADRLKEIGLRKALGATKQSIRMLFLSESLMLCIAAGIIGVIIGLGLCQAGIYMATQLVKTLKFEWVLDPFALGLALISIVSVGIISGLIPALKAEKLEVIEALRSE